MPATNGEFDAEAYWVERHERLASSREATGLAGAGERANAALYRMRERALRAALGTSDLSGRTVLDAGCGNGEFAALYRALGARVYGCDVSPLAVERCAAAGPGVFRCGRMDQAPNLFPGVRFNIVHCFDVLYHIVDDRQWQRTLAALHEVTAPGGQWLVTEFAGPRAVEAHVRYRSRPAYEAELARLGRGIAGEWRLHWLYGASPWCHTRLPALAGPLEPLCGLPLLGRLANTVLWRIVPLPAGKGPA